MVQSHHRMLAYFCNLLRWNDWSYVRIPFVFIVVLYFQYTDQVLGAGLVAYRTFFFIFLFSVAYYAFLFLVNDIVDFDQDVIGKHKDAGRNRQFMVYLAGILFTIGTFFAVASWQAISPQSVVVLLVGYGLAFFYSAPPLRFKEKGAWGIVIGSLVLRPMAPVIAMIGLMKRDHIIMLGLFIFWMTVFGIRSMLFHQIDDYAADKKAGVRTFVTLRGAPHAKRLISSIFFPTELLSMLLIGVGMMGNIPLLGGSLLVAVLAAGFRYKSNRMFQKLTIAHYRPLLGSIAFLLLPFVLAVMVAIKYSLLLIPLFVVYWQRNFAVELLHRFHTKMK